MCIREAELLRKHFIEQEVFADFKCDDLGQHVFFKPMPLHQYCSKPGYFLASFSASVIRLRSYYLPMQMYEISIHIMPCRWQACDVPSRTAFVEDFPVEQG